MQEVYIQLQVQAAQLQLLDEKSRGSCRQSFLQELQGLLVFCLDVYMPLGRCCLGRCWTLQGPWRRRLTGSRTLQGTGRQDREGPCNPTAAEG